MKVLISLIFILSFYSTSFANSISTQCNRIISLSPTITDTLLSLGLEQQIVAGTRYDRLPSNSDIQQIGGMLDPNYEAITMLSPTIIFADVTSDSPQKRKLDALQLNTTLLEFSSLEQIKQSLTTIGEICHLEKITQAKLHDLTTTLNSVKIAQSPTVLMLYTYEGDNHINTLPQRAAGKSFHQDILEITGARNIYQGNLNAPIMSSEAILMLNPDVIILIQGDQNKSLDENRTITVNKIEPQWPNLQDLSAIQNSQVYLMQGEPTFIASPDAVMATLKSFHSILKSFPHNP